MLNLKLPDVLTRPLRLPFESEPILAEAAMSSAGESREVGAYLDDVVRRLSSLPPQTRASVRAELRAHLEASIIAREELGENRESAPAAAIRQFGEPRVIARRFHRAWNATAGETPWPAMRAAFRLFSLAVAVYFGGLAINNYVVLRYVSAWFGHDAWSFFYFFWFSGALVVLPVVAGARVGWTFPRRGWQGTALALSAASICATPQYFLCLRYITAHPTALYHYDVKFFAFLACFTLVIGLLISLPIGTIAALIVGQAKIWRRSYQLRWRPLL